MTQGTHRRRLGRTLKLIAFSLTPVIVLVIIAETIATMSITRRSLILPDTASGGSIYRMRIGKWPWSKRSVTPLNSLGFPDHEFPVAGTKKDGCVHVVFVGDSFVFGDGVDRDSNFVEVVRRQAASRPSARCTRFFNLAVRGTTIDQQSKKVLETMDRVQPDLVILGQYQNDLTDFTNPGGLLDPNRPRPGERPQGDSIRVTLSFFKVNTVKVLTYRAFAAMIQRGIKRDELRHWSVMADSSRLPDAKRFQEIYSRLYGELVTTLRARGIGFGVVILPSKLDVLAGRYPEETYFIELARRHDVDYLRLFPTFDAQRSPYAFLMYDGHLNERGNRLVAGEVLRWLYDTMPAPFPILRNSPGAGPTAGS